MDSLVFKLKSRFKKIYFYYIGLPEVQANQLLDWKNRKFSDPSPPTVKRIRLLEIGEDNSTWVETGTYEGETTQLLAQNSEKVFTIEPADSIFFETTKRLGHIENIQFIHGKSEEVFPSLLPKLSGNVNFFLDGHFSGGDTFLGKKEAPIVEELEQIELCLPNLNLVTVIVDDVRLFGPRIESNSSYPSINYLVDWANKNKLAWHIEHDMFVAQSKKF